MADEPIVVQRAAQRPTAVAESMQLFGPSSAEVKGGAEKLFTDAAPPTAEVQPLLEVEGYVAQSTGDGIFALFGAAVAYVDHPQRALYSALRMQDELKRYSDLILSDSTVRGH